MKAEDLRLAELLELKPTEGEISFQGRRMLLWDADTVGELRRELIEAMGPEAARRALIRFGFANGYRDCLATGRSFRWDSDAEWWLSCPALQCSEGKVQAEAIRQVVDRGRGEFEAELRWHNSVEAVQHQRHFGVASQPVCWTLSGYASGFATALMGEEVLLVEEECAAMGGTCCRVVGTTRRAWGASGKELAAACEITSLTDELAAACETTHQSARLEARDAELSPRQHHQPPLSPLHGAASGSRHSITAKSRLMEKVLELVDTVARVDTTVLLTGESGVGKERIARCIHAQSPRAGKNLLAINCGALPEPLLESELFGHVRGAFTGADAAKEGLFEAARGGTIFLDEIGEMSPATQIKLLRVLQEREVLPVGSTTTVPIDVRVIAATNRDLDRMVENGTFRKDLYYRLNVVSVEVPPLRERPEDILPLAREFLDATCKSFGIAPRTLLPEAAECLTAHGWPGNIRELENAIERAVVVAGDCSSIGAEHLPQTVRLGVSSAHGMQFDQVVTMAEMEKSYVLRVLDRFNGNRTHTARALGIGANTLWRKLKAWGVPAARPRAEDIS